MSTLSSLLEGPLADAVGRALVHVVWQASLVALLLAGALAAMRRSSASARYAVSCAALALTIALPLATGALAWRAEDSVATSPSKQVAGAVLPMPLASADAGPATPSTAESGAASLASIPLDPALPWVVGFWLAGVTLLSARIVVALVSARRLAESGIETLPRAWSATLARLADAMGIDRAVRLLESTRVDVPTVVGWFSPVILVPASALSGLTPQQLETVLAHELAHIRRHDYVVNLIQTLVETLLFYHPAVWWISNRVRVEREHCCDDDAVALCGDAVGYARALATLEEMRAARVPAPALAATGGALLERVRRLVGLADDDLGSSRPIAALIALMVVSAAIAIPLSARGSRAETASGTSIVVDGSRDDTRPEVAGIWVDSDAPPFALASVAGETPDADPFATVFEASELADAMLELHQAELERQMAGIERQRHEIERSIREAMSERDSVEQAVRESMSERESVEQAVHEALAELDSTRWRIAMALTPAPPAPPSPTAAPNPLVAPRAPRAWSTFPVIAPVAPIAPTPMASPTPPVAPLPPMPYPLTPLPPIAPRAFEGSGRPVDPDNPSVDDMIILHAAGVDAGYVREMKKAGLERLTAHQLALLDAAGVDGDYATSMQKLLGQKLLWSDLVRLRALDIDESDVEELREAGKRVDLESLTQLRGIGIDQEELDKLRSSIDRSLSASEAAWLQGNEVDADYVAELQRAGLGKLSAREYGILKSAGVDGDYVRELRAAGLDRLDTATLYQLKATGVDGEWAREIRASGYKSLSASDLVGLHAVGVDGEYLRELAAAGFSALPADQLMRLHAAGIGADELREWKGK